MKRITLTITLAAAIASANSRTAHVDPELLSGQGESNVIVVYQDDDDDTSRRKREEAITSGGGRNHKSHRQLRMGSLRTNRSLIETLRKDPKIRSISVDRTVSAAASKHFDPDEAREAAGLSGSSKGAYPGTGIGVAVIDSGVSPLDALRGGSSCSSSRIVYSENFASDSGVADLFGHGTHVASILGADSKCDKTDYMGVASAVNIINLRVLNGQGVSTDSRVIAAIDRAIQLKSTHNIRVMNLSLGRPVTQSFQTDPLCQAVERAWKAGIVVVVAAGNLGRYATTQGYATIAAPGNDPFVITVGAARNPEDGSDSQSDDTVSSFSSKGPTAIDHVVKPDLVAPGNLMVARTVFPSTLTSLLPGNAMVMDSKQYLKLSGTSMAAPVVAGVAAMIIHKDSTMTPDQVKARLMKTAWKGFVPTASIIDSATNTRYSVQHDVFTAGAGYVAADEALRSTEKIGSTKSAISPLAQVVNGKVVLSTAYPGLGTLNIIWGESSAWATNLVWGQNVILPNNIIWGSNIIWGTNVAGGYNIIWGESSVTGSSNPFPLALTAAGDK
ncbi:MAG: hypothetical protein FJW39_05615 [Acidobacteria bacterium]|nr:hypothetical protein [Acidobacteriota bacterium]